MVEQRQPTPVPLTVATRRHIMWVLLGGLLLTIAGALLAHLLERRSEQRQFARQAHLVGQQLQRDLVTPLEVVYALAILFEASVEVTHQEFETFAQPMLRRHPSMTALLWVPKVVRADRERYVARLREEVEDYEIRELGVSPNPQPASPRLVHFPIRYVEPHTPSALGLDLAGEQGWADWIAEAMTEDSVFVTPRFKLLGRPEDHAVAAYVPVFQAGARSAGSAPGDEALRGVALGLFRIAPMAEAILEGQPLEGLAIVLHDGVGEQSQLLYASGGEDIAADETHGHWHRSFAMGNRTWSIGIHGTETLGWMGPATVGLVGLLLTVALALALLLQHRLSALRRNVERLGQYVLHEKLGEGGMGEVFRAQHAVLRRPTAIKLIRKDIGGGEEARRRFEREVRAASELTHPNAVVVYDYGLTPDGSLYYAMEYVDGIDLQQLVRSFGALPPRRAVHLLAQICGALDEAHSRGLVHRDIKPANLMVCQRGGIYDFAKVLDFGLVLVRRSGDEARVSGEFAFLGTPHYMAPEQLTAPAEVGPPVDLYALGCVAYFLLTSTEVFDGDTSRQIGQQHIKATPLPPSLRTKQAIPEELEKLVLQCLAKAPEDRPRSAGALARALAACVELEPWTQQDAAAWWAAHPEALERADPRPQGPQVLDIDVTQRGRSLALSEPDELRTTVVE